MDHGNDPPPPYSRLPDQGQSGRPSDNATTEPSVASPAESKPPLPPRPQKPVPRTSFSDLVPSSSSSQGPKLPLNWTLYRSNGALFISDSATPVPVPTPLFAVSPSPRPAAGPNQPSDLILHSGPNASDSPLATGERRKTFAGGTHSVITLPGAGSGISPEEPLRTNISWPHISYSFDMDVGRGSDLGRLRRETFEWRHSSGSAIGSLGAAGTGWKLLRLSNEPLPGTADSFASAGPGGGELSSDEKEIVAIWAEARRHLGGNEVIKFRFMGTGAGGALGERWEVMTVMTALRMWQQGEMARS